VCCVSIYILFFELYSELRKLVEAKLLVNSDIKAQFEIDYLARLISSRIFQRNKERNIEEKSCSWHSKFTLNKKQEEVKRLREIVGGK